MDEAGQVGIDLLVISTIFVIGFILGWLVYPLTENKHDKEAYLRGNSSNPRKKCSDMRCFMCSYLHLGDIYRNAST